MKRTFIVALLSILAIVSLVVPTPGMAQSMSTVQKGTPLNASSDPITGYVTPAIATQAVGAVTPVRMTPLPAGTVAVTVISTAAINYGASTVAAASSGEYLSFAANTPKTFNIYPNTTQPTIWFCSQIPGATASINLFAHVQK